MPSVGGIEKETIMTKWIIAAAVAMVILRRKPREMDT